MLGGVTERAQSACLLSSGSIILRPTSVFDTRFAAKNLAGSCKLPGFGTTARRPAPATMPSKGFGTRDGACH